MSEAKLCCNCLHCARWKTKDGIETHCDLTDKYLGYLQVMEENTDCKHWEKETKWDLQKEHDKQIRADAIAEYKSKLETDVTARAQNCYKTMFNEREQEIFNFATKTFLDAMDYFARQMKEQNNTYTAKVDGVKREFM